MPTIRQLPSSLINKIAAGEVIERPASVVKELLENSVDAGATRIELAVEKGGLELVRVSDDGCGIDPEQLVLAVASHATSKLETADDLFDISTLGFRGEALASIAEISHLEIRSRTAQSDSGAMVSVRGGEMTGPTPVGCPVGTVMSVRHLFFNTPVRRKFLKSPQTEMGHVIEAFTRIALAYPRVHFVLTSNDRSLYDLPPTDRWADRIRAFFGEDVGDNLIAVESQLDEIRLRGFVADPAVSRSNNRMQYLFLNGRFIRDRSLQHALTEAYRGLLMVGRYPVSFLRLELPPNLVDVNVHPTKMEVRFQDGGRIYSQLLQMLRHKFLSTDLTAKGKSSQGDNQRVPLPSAVNPAAGEDGVDRWSEHEQNLQSWAQGKSPSAIPTPHIPVAGESRFSQPNTISAQASPRLSFGPTPEFRPFPGGALSGYPGSMGSNTVARDTVARDLSTPQYATIERSPNESSWDSPQTFERPTYSTMQQESTRPTSAASAIPLSPIPLPPGATSWNGDIPHPVTSQVGFQVHQRYIVTEDEQGMVIIDQHALHERILYEQVRDKVLGTTLEIQRLLVPEPVSLTPAERAVALDSIELLEKVGISLAPFGGDTVLITSYPAMLARLTPGEMLQQVIETLMNSGKEPDPRDLLDHLLHTIACKAAIKAGDRLSSEEITSLLEQRHLFQDTHHCPHGRPTALFFSREQLDKMFKRT